MKNFPVPTRILKAQSLLRTSILFFIVCFCDAATADTDDHQTFGEYSIHYVVFNSTFIQPDVAASYGLKRSKYESLLNLSVYKKNQTGTIPAKIAGNSRNLMQQLKSLEVIEINEKDAIYYLVPLRVSGKELLHFDFEVQPEGAAESFNLKFSKTLYSD